jgi:glycosyltransferase involved in cell wall biosynthesis
MRLKGHKVWIGQPDSEGFFSWWDGTSRVNQQPGLDVGFKSRFTNLKFIKQIKNYLKDIRPDVVQINPNQWTWLIPFGMPSHMKFIMDIRITGSGSEQPLINWIKNLKTRFFWRLENDFFFDHTTFLNEISAQWLYGRNWSRLSSVIPLGVDGKFLTYVHHTDINLFDPSVKFIYAGTISKIRKLEKLLLASKILDQKGYNFRLAFVGPDDLLNSRKYYADQINELKLTEIVNILPAYPYSDVPTLLSNYDVALNYLPVIRGNRRQPSMKILEACALGIPQICTKIDANYEYVIENKNGIYVDDTPEAIAGGMEKFIIDRSWREQIKRSALENRKGSDWDNIASRYIDLYVSLSDRRTKVI